MRADTTKVLITVLVADVMATFDGTTPTADNGHILKVGSSWVLDVSVASALQAVRRTSIAAVVIATEFYPRSDDVLEFKSSINMGATGGGAYSTGDLIGAVQPVSLVQPAAYGGPASLEITQVTITDNEGNAVDLTLWLGGDDTGSHADNDPFEPSATELRALFGVVPITDFIELAGKTVGIWRGSQMVRLVPGQYLYLALLAGDMIEYTLDNQVEITVVARRLSSSDRYTTVLP